MLYHDRIDVFEAIDVKMTSESKKCDICYYWYFLNKVFKFQPNVWNGCHNLLMSVSLGNIAISDIKNDDYYCIFSGISKREAANLKLNINFTEKSGTL